MIRRIIYVSSARKLLDGDDLRQLVFEAAAKNEKLGITGAIAYKDGSFMQVIEGDENRIEQIFSSIANDTRHHGIILIIDDNDEERHFPNQHMTVFSSSDTPLVGEQNISTTLLNGFLGR